MTTEPTGDRPRPVDLPLRMDREPTPVEGCRQCVEPAAIRSRARAGGDMSAVTGGNVLMNRHLREHQ
nr:hypothetical protein [Streptomyces benahoarensis]